MTNDRSKAQASGSSDMGVDVAGLRKVAEAATPGPWHYKYEPIDDLHWGPTMSNVVTRGDKSSYVSGDQDGDFEYIAAIDPSTLLKLLDLLNAKERELGEAKERVHDLEMFNWSIDLDRLEKQAERLQAELAEARIVEKMDKLDVATARAKVKQLQAKVEAIRAIPELDSVSYTEYGNAFDDGFNDCRERVLDVLDADA